jgi:hypothetical protein
MGYGMLIDAYDNSVSFDKRKLGAEFDILVNDVVGLEGMYSDFDFTSFNLLGVRPYYRPLGQSEIPIIKTLEFGVGYVTDYDKTQIETEKDTIRNNYFLDKGHQAFSGDVGLQLLNNSFVHLAVYGQYGYMVKNTSDSLKKVLDILSADPMLDAAHRDHIKNYKDGSGISAGIDLKIKILDKILRTDLRLERVWYNDYFVPQFFDVGYEMNKDGKILELVETKKKTGTIGSLKIIALSKIKVGGSLWIPDGMGEQAPALLHIEADASELTEKFVLKGSYVKAGITDLSDALKIDDRSLARLRVAYRFYKVLEVGLDYKWTFATDKDDNWKASNYISPYFGLNIPLNF